ncbi:MAG: hypothetical protein GYA57_05400 [Myxococcales bacterium]|nr:hypothetical protein [Myxococcales bacterium]
MRTSRRNPTTALAVFGGLTLLVWRVAADAPPAGGPATPLFDVADNCLACHNGLIGASGADVSVGTDWRSSMMANAARDPYWHAAVRRETLDHPSAAADIEAECSICHMPMARYTAHAGGGRGEVFANLPVGRSIAPQAALAGDGVSCTLCHQILPEGLDSRESLVGRFVVDERTAWGARRIFGPFDVTGGHARVMSSAAQFVPQAGEHIRGSALCGSCHTLFTHSLGPGGEVVAEFPEQVPYLEWQHSRYPATTGCRDCHMKPVDGPTLISSVLGEYREGVLAHVFRGGNFFVPRLLNAHRAELGVAALPSELEATAERTVVHLRENAAQIALAAERTGSALRVRVTVRNLAGHKLPSAYPSRRVWLHLAVEDGGGRVLFESGALQPDGSIAGNDNDADAASYEPHHAVIESADQVQIYEPILGDPDGRVTTGLLTATRYLKDNRLLPDGFDKATAGPDIAVAGDAASDEDFTAGGDTVEYRLTLPEDAGNVAVRAALYYQPIGYRWAHNLDDDRQAEELARFVDYYQAAADRSAVRLAAAEAVLTAAPVEPPSTVAAGGSLQAPPVAR